MADYIYLLQNRLTPAQRRALERVRDAARSHNMTVFLVGGATRDLTSGTPVRDLDFAVQGEVPAMAEELKAGGATVAGENPARSSVYLLFPGGVRTEIASTLTVSYPKPGSDPETQPAAILDDLRHRDFTANAMAISLNEGSYGLLLDPLNGVADIENRELRLVSNYGFIEQPSLLLRVARLAERLGWTLEERTQSRYETAQQENYIATLSERDRGYELEEIFYEEDPLATMDHLTGEGWGDALYPAWTSAKADRDALERVRDLMGQLDQMGIHIDPSPVFFPLLTARLDPEELAGLKGMLVRPGFVRQIESLDARSKELAAQMTARGAAAPSDTWKLLFSAEPEVVLWLAFSSRSNAVQAKFKAFLNEWPQMRQRIPYATMQEMRITPDLREYNQLLEELFFALIDGKLDTAEATRAFLEPYSPPAPAPQASPRRRPAKATRSRSRKAAAAVEPELAEADAPTEEVENAPAPKTPAPVAAAKAGPTKPAAKKAASPPAEPVKATETHRLAEKKTSVPSPAAPAKAVARAVTPVKAAGSAPAKAVAKSIAKPSKSVAPAAVAKKTATSPKKAAASSGSSKSNAVKAAPSSSHSKQPAKKAPAKTAKPVAKSAAKAPAGKNSSGVRAGGHAAAKKAAAKKAAPNKRRPAAPAKRAVSPKKAAKAAAKGRRR